MRTRLERHIKGFKVLEEVEDHVTQRPKFLRVTCKYYNNKKDLLKIILAGEVLSTNQPALSSIEKKAVK